MSTHTLQLTSQPLNVKKLIALGHKRVQVQYLGTGEYLNNFITDISFTNAATEIDVEVMVYNEAEAKVAGKIKTEVWLTCKRCLEQFAYPISHQFSVSFVEGIGEIEREHELSDAEIDILQMELGKIDIINLLREEVLLNLPMEPLCDRNCRGLCSMCGANLNKTKCNCTQNSYHALEKLKDILESGK